MSANVCLYDLSDLTIVKFYGPDSQSFLHSQLSNSIQNMQPNTAKPAAYCTAQGRIIANGIIYMQTTDCYYFIVAQDLAQSFIKRISLFKLRLKLTIEILADTHIYGLIGTDQLPAELSAQAGWASQTESAQIWIKYPDLPGQKTLAILLENQPAATLQDKSAWHSLRLTHGWPLIHANTQEKFLPASLNMDLNGTIDFSKGCYPGQEIIARSHYRGTVKRRLAYGNCTSNSTGQVSDLFEFGSDYSKPIARIIESIRYDNTIFLNAEINIADKYTYSLGPNEPRLQLDLFA